MSAFNTRGVIYATNCTLAALLALYVAFSAGLPNPGWASLTVFLVSQPLGAASGSEFELHSTTARIGVATADLYPKITLGASIGSVGLNKNFLDADTLKFSLGPLITWQFPDRSRIQARIRSADADQQIAFAHFDSAVLNALKEVESALETYARDLERRALLEAARQKASRAAEETQQLFALGRQGYLPVLDATRTLTIVEQSVAAADSKLASDQVNVFLALGGGWEEKP